MSEPTGNPTGVIGAAAVGIITVLVRELVRTGALKPDQFLADLDALASLPQPVPQTPDEERLEQKVFDLVRKAVQAGVGEAS